MESNSQYNGGKAYWTKIMLSTFAIIFISIFSGGPCYDIVHSLFLDKNGISTVGIVDSIEDISNTDVDALRFGISFKYRNVRYRTFNKVLTNQAIYHLGEPVSIKFMAEDPESAVMNNSVEKYYGYLPNIIFGLILLSFMVFYSLKK